MFSVHCCQNVLTLNSSCRDIQCRHLTLSNITINTDLDFKCLFSAGFSSRGAGSLSLKDMQTGLRAAQAAAAPFLMLVMKYSRPQVHKVYLRSTSHWSLDSASQPFCSLLCGKSRKLILKSNETFTMS